MAAETLAAQKKMMVEVDAALGVIRETLDDLRIDIDRLGDKVEDNENDRDSTVAHAFEDHEDRMDQLEVDITTVGDRVAEFQRMGFLLRLQWLLTGAFPEPKVK